MKPLLIIRLDTVHESQKINVNKTSQERKKMILINLNGMRLFSIMVWFKMQNMYSEIFRYLFCMVTGILTG